MRYSEIDADFQKAAFDFYYWFSRFEFVLKEDRKFRKTEGKKKRVKPDWEAFEKKFKREYRASEGAISFIALRPKYQVETNGELAWVEVGFEHCRRNCLGQIITCLKTVRNNLFHGGKHGDMEQDDVSRNILLLKLGKEVLDELAVLADVEGDYLRYY